MDNQAFEETEVEKGPCSSKYKEEYLKMENSEVCDHGWAWFVAFGAFISRFIVTGINVKSMGMNISHFRKFVSSPFFSIIGTKISMRTLTAFGSCLLCAAHIGIYFSPNIEMVIVSFGVIGGAASGLSTFFSVVMISLYFDKRRSLANSINYLGSSLGSLIFPLALESLYKSYGGREEKVPKWHKKCRSWYINEQNYTSLALKKQGKSLDAVKVEETGTSKSPRCATRPAVPAFFSKKQCVICGKEYYKSRKLTLKVTTKKREAAITEKAKSLKQDELLRRIERVGHDMVANDICYHKECMDRFMSIKPKKGKSVEEVVYDKTKLKELGLDEFWMKTQQDSHLPIHKIANTLDADLCRALPLIHSLSGRDITSYPFFIGKTTWLQKSKTVPLDYIASYAEAEDDYSLTEDVIDQARQLFIAVYSSSSNELSQFDSLAELRAHKFLKSNATDLKRLPSTEDAFLLHLERSAYACIIDKTAHIANPVIPEPTEYGWISEGDNMIPHQMRNPSWPADAAKATNCSCKKGCQRSCSCSKASRRCNIDCLCRGHPDTCKRARLQELENESSDEESSGSSEGDLED
ncbi:Monocarboxylate transporter 14 [Nymphon striatum]|nr:Monocarboxylate transporter 14 [Nymphon striatum]